MNAPKAPDPTATAKAQQGYNIGAGTAQQNLNMVDQSNPFGSTTYKQIGTNPDGTPKFAQTNGVSSQFQPVVDNAASALSTPFDGSNDATEARLIELGQKRLDPLLSRRRESSEQNLFNRGVRPGSEAYKNGMGDVTAGENDAYDQLILSGHNQAISDALMQRNQPIAEAQAIAGLGANNPATPQAGIAPVDYSGLVSNNYNAQTQQYGDMWSGIGNLAGTAFGGWAGNGFKLPKFSDERLKTDIHSTGEQTPDGIPIKSYRYKGSPLMQLGVIAQDAKKKRPDAVKRGPGGFLMVDMAKVA